MEPARGRVAGEPRIRHARDSDSEAVIALIDRVYAEYPGCVLDVDREERALRTPASSFDGFWVLEHEGAILGCAACSLLESPAAGRALEVKKVYLDRGWRGRGLGRRLVETVEEEASRLGIRRLVLWSDTRFATAHAVYARLGYIRTGNVRELHDLSRSREFEFLKEL